MAQIFPPSANYLARGTLFVLPLVPAAIIGLLYAINDSSYIDQEDVVKEQVVPFSHQHHVGGLGIDCRYCHNSVEESSFAGIPPTHTCMSCHSQIWTNAEMLEPVRESYRSGTPLTWVRVHDLPDFVYFNHSIHIAKGVGCESCHGRVDQMPLMRMENAMHMSFCLDCHRNPEAHLRPESEITTMGYHAEDQATLGAELVEANNVTNNDNCYTCHR